MEIDKKNIAIWKFIFRAVSSDAHPYTFNNRCELLDEINISRIPPDFSPTIFSAEITPSLVDKDEVFIIRKIICEQLAEGNISRPVIVSSSILMKGNESSYLSMIREREESARAEEQLHQQFNAILDSLCYDTSNSEAWYRICIRLSIKADIIRYRIISGRMTNVTEFRAFGAYDPKVFLSSQPLHPQTHDILIVYLFGNCLKRHFSHINVNQKNTRTLSGMIFLCMVQHIGQLSYC